jgi:hypothetical protein
MQPLPATRDYYKLTSMQETKEQPQAAVRKKEFFSL